MAIARNAYFQCTSIIQYLHKPFINFCSIFICILCTDDAYSQGGCEYTPSSKIQKLLDQSFDMKKYETNERIEFLERALDEDAKCTPCLMRIAEIEFKMAKRGGSFAASKQHFQQLDELCPNYHSEVYYYLGAMSYADREYEKAIDYFEKFLRFPDSDPTKFEKDYQKKYAEVEEALKSVKAYAEIYKDNIDYKPIRVTGVSSPTDDYLPLISPDGEIMFFTRTVSKQAKGDIATRTYEYFSWCKRPDINTNFDEGNALPEPFNQGANCGGATITVDNRELIVAMKNPNPKNPDNIDLFSTKYSLKTTEMGQKIYQWGPLESLGDFVNTPDGFEGQPTLSGDAKTLYFVGVRPECVKDPSGNYSHDIFFSRRASDGSWGKAQPIGGGINTTGQEKGPFMHSDSKTLYFASDGHIGVGKMDLYYCKVNDENQIDKINNIGFPINSELDELGIVVTSDGELAYFGAKNFQNNKGWDVYEFKMPEKAKPEKVMVVKGQVKKTSGDPPENATVEITYTESKRKEEISVNSDDGSYAAVVKMQSNETVTLSIEGEDIAFNSRVIAKKDEPAPVVAKLNMETREAKANESFIINDIYYSTNSAEIEPRSKIILDAFAEYLNDHPAMVIEIAGHTDSRGDENANKALSAERAFEVMKYLVDHGVNAKRLAYQGYGESRPLGDNNTEEGRAMNRRTEFLIKKM
jgi:outer membrane protein OmpA-like peptidoglycan-associated protein/tetratricopeptide (TPR) repeat protein